MRSWTHVLSVAALGLCASCLTPEEPLNEHYIPPTGESAPANTVDAKDVLQAKPSTKPESEEDGAPAVNVSHSCTDSISGKQYAERDTGYQECMARSLQDAKQNKQ